MYTCIYIDKGSMTETFQNWLWIDWNGGLLFNLYKMVTWKFNIWYNCSGSDTPQYTCTNGQKIPHIQPSPSVKQIGMYTIVYEKTWKYQETSYHLIIVPLIICYIVNNHNDIGYVFVVILYVRLSCK